MGELMTGIVIFMEVLAVVLGIAFVAPFIILAVRWWFEFWLD